MRMYYQEYPITVASGGDTKAQTIEHPPLKLYYMALIAPDLDGTDTCKISIEHPTRGDGTDFVWIPATLLGATLAENDIHESALFPADANGARFYPLPALPLVSGQNAHTSGFGMGSLARVTCSGAQAADRDFILIFSGEEY